MREHVPLQIDCANLLGGAPIREPQSFPSEIFNPIPTSDLSRSFLPYERPNLETNQ